MIKSTKLHELNPKLPRDGKGNGVTYVKGGQLKFMVTDDLHVLPLSSSTALQVITDANMKVGELQEKEIILNKLQVIICFTLTVIPVSITMHNFTFDASF